MEEMPTKIWTTFKRKCALLGPCYYYSFLPRLLYMAIRAQEEGNGIFIRSPESSMSRSLISAGYTRMAALLAHPEAVGFDLATYRNLTLFALPDHALLPILHSNGLPRTIHSHASAQKLSYRDMLTLRSGVRIPSLEAGQGFVIRRRKVARNISGSAIVTLHGHALVVLPDLYSDGNVIVHGIDRLVDGKEVKKHQKIKKLRRPRKRVKRSRNSRKSHLSSCGLKWRGDSNTRPCGSKDCLTSGHSHMQASRPNVPGSIPKRGFNGSEISSNQPNNLLDSGFKRRGKDHGHMDWLGH